MIWVCSKGKTFWMWEGNRRISVWWLDIDHVNHNEVGGTTLSIAFFWNPSGSIGVVFDLMDDVNMLQN